MAILGDRYPLCVSLWFFKIFFLVNAKDYLFKFHDKEGIRPLLLVKINYFSYL